MSYQEWCGVPTYTLPEPLRSLVVDGAEAVGVDPTYLLLPGLAVAATAIGNTRRIAVNETWSEPAVIWSAVVGDPGQRKSPPFKLAIKPLEDHQDALDDEHNVEDENAPRRAVLVTDITIERLAGLLNENPRGVGMLRDELSTWFTGLTRYRREGSDAANWLELFNDGRFHVHRKTGTPRYVSVRMANVSIAGTIQPEVLARCFAGGNLENGLASRFLLAHPPKKLALGFPKALPERTARAWSVCIRRLLSIPMEQDESGKSHPLILAMNPEAAKVWWGFYAAHQRRTHEATGAYAAGLSKLERYTLRLALVLQLVTQAYDPLGDYSAPVTTEAMQSAVDCVEWFIGETKRIYGHLSETPEQAHARRAIEWLARKQPTTMSKMISAGLFASAGEGEAVMHRLHEAGIVDIKTVQPEGRGRPATEYRLKATG